MYVCVVTYVELRLFLPSMSFISSCALLVCSVCISTFICLSAYVCTLDCNPCVLMLSVVLAGMRTEVSYLRALVLLSALLASVRLCVCFVRVRLPCTVFAALR